MKFKEMTWKELEEDFKNFLDNFTTKELVESLRKYAVNSDENYSYMKSTENNLNESCTVDEDSIRFSKEEYGDKEEYIKKEDIIEIDSYQSLEIGEAA